MRRRAHSSGSRPSALTWTSTWDWVDGKARGGALAGQQRGEERGGSGRSVGSRPSTVCRPSAALSSAWRAETTSRSCGRATLRLSRSTATPLKAPGE